MLQDSVTTQKCTDPPTSSDNALNMLQNHEILRAACAKLTVKSKDKKLDVFFRARITAMVGVLNLYLDSHLSYTWRKASIVVSKAQGHGVKHARNLHQWILNFVRYDQLPLHRYGQTRSSVLDDEDVAQTIQLRLAEKAKEGFIKAIDVVDIVASLEMQANFTRLGICKPKISERTARNWLAKLKWRYGRTRNGMYIDGHEREDVVEY